MKLHSEGQKDYLKELEKEKKREITTALKEGKVTLIRKIIAKFNRLKKESDQSLFLSN